MAVAVSTAGRIAVAGHDGGINDDRPTASTLVVYKSDGSIDKSFDSDGVIDTSAFGAGFVDVAFQSDGKILALGKKLVRFNPDGSLDKTFGGGDGIVDVDGRKLALDATGRIVVLGQNALFRYTAAGSRPTPSFDGDGIRPSVKGYDLALAPDGDLLVVGNGGNQDQLSRFNPDGSADDAFGNHGNVFAPGGVSLAVTANNIFVGGVASELVLPYDDFRIDAFTQSGQVRHDLWRLYKGRVQTDFGWTRDHVVGLAIQQGKLLALGVADVNLNGGTTSRSEPALARYQLATTTPTQSPFNGTPDQRHRRRQRRTIRQGRRRRRLPRHRIRRTSAAPTARPRASTSSTPATPSTPTSSASSRPASGSSTPSTSPRPARTTSTSSSPHLKNGGKFHLEVDGQNVTGSLAVPNTGNWTTFTATSPSAASNLTAGTHVLRLAFDTNGDIGYVGNFDQIVFRPVTSPRPAVPLLRHPGQGRDRVESENYD